MIDELLFDLETVSRFVGKNQAYFELEEPKLYVTRYRDMMKKFAKKYNVIKDISDNLEDYIDEDDGRNEVYNLIDRQGFAYQMAVIFKIKDLIKEQ